MVRGDVTVRDGDRVPAMIGGDLIVASGRVMIDGMVNGDLRVEAGATAVLSGMVNGSIRGPGRVERPSE